MPIRRTEPYACPVQLTLDVVGGKWKPLILWLLRTGNARRFNDLLSAMTPITHKVLAEQLRQLERDGLVERTVSGDPKVRVDYRLTGLGATLRPVLDQMAGWAKRHHAVYGASLKTPR